MKSSEAGRIYRDASGEGGHARAAHSKEAVLAD